MANLYLPTASQYVIQGDGVSTTATIALNFVPAAAAFVSATQASNNGDVSNNVSSVTVSGTTATVNFVAPFSYAVLISLSFTYPNALAVSVTAVVADEVNQGDQGTPVESWFVELTDGTNPLGILTNPVRMDPTGTTTQPVSGSVVVTNLPATQYIAGSVVVTNLPAIQPVSGSVTALVSGSVAVTNFPSSQPISGSVSVSNFPAVQTANITEWNGIALGSPTAFGTAPTGLVIGGNVSLFAGSTALGADASGNLNVDIAAGSITARISGSVTVGNFPATQPVSGTITALQGTSPWVVSGSVTALPSGIQPISGSVAVTNFPAIQAVAGSVTALISGSVTVGNFPTTQPISGAVSVSNFPATQPISGSVTALISGSVTVGNFPALQNVNVADWDGVGLAAPTAWGTAPTGIVIGGNVELFAGNASLVADGSSNLKVNIAACGAALPLPTGAATSVLQPVPAVITAATAPVNGIATLGVLESTPPVLVTGQSVAHQTDFGGQLFVKPHRRSLTAVGFVNGLTSASGVTLLGAQAAGVFADLGSLCITVGKGSTANVYFYVTVNDGTNLYEFNCFSSDVTTLASSTQVSACFNPPIPATHAATAWTVNVSSTTDAPTVNVVATFVLQTAS
jgi:hypothetical protein